MKILRYFLQFLQMTTLKFMSLVDTHFKESHGVYRDDGLIDIKGNERDMDVLRTRLIQTYKENALSIIVEPHCKGVSYLDITVGLEHNLYELYAKPNSKILYIDRGSNHPPTTIRELPMMIAKRLYSISANKDIFDDHKRVYDIALIKGVTGKHWNIQFLCRRMTVVKTDP